MSLNTKLWCILPPFFKVKLWPEFDPPFGGLLRPIRGQNGIKRNLAPCCRNARLWQTDTVLVANSTTLSKSVWSTAKLMPTLVLRLWILGTHPCRSNHFVTDYAKDWNESTLPIAASMVFGGFKSHMTVDTRACTNVFGTTVITTQASA